jgi:hypothetical protein
MYIRRLAENSVQKAFFVFEIFSFEVVHACMYKKRFFCAVTDLTCWRFCYDKARELKFADLAVYIVRHAQHMIPENGRVALRVYT